MEATTLSHPDRNTFHHDQAAQIGVLLVNLGTPDAPTRAAVRRYLKEFLWDPRVVEMARPLWWLVLNGVILNTRPARSAKAYQKIWTDEGSPLLTISRRQRDALADVVAQRFGCGVPMALGMRYGSPSIRSALAELRDAGARRILVLPLYPQYSATTTASIFDAVTAELRGWRWLPELRFINHYHDEAAYIGALTDSVRRHRAESGDAERLLMSFHGIPEEYFHAGDPYYCECQKTGRLLAENLGLEADDWLISFQSRLGPKQWLQPYTDKTLEGLAHSGVKSVQVLCPGFSADCLETLEEVAMEDREIFLAAGGERYEYIPCLNDDADHISMLAGLIDQHTQGWGPGLDEPSQVLQRAIALGASQ
ncbi:MAG: ferrochelatase [Gammaproteobacteria bacterium]|nr:ferrochelatase [Gammaproteobacteria bacterium]